MELLAAAARVLRTYPLGETSLIAVLLTRERGLLRAVAKGARRPKSAVRALLEPGASLDAVLYLRPRGLHLVKELSPRGPLPRPAPGLEALALRLAPLELILLTTQEGEAPAGLFDLIEDAMAADAAAGGMGWLAFFAFEAALLRVHGLGLEPGHCGMCGRPLAPDRLRFLPGEAQFACPACGGEGLDLAQASADCLNAISLVRPSALAGRPLLAPVRRQVGRVLHLALSRHLPGYRLPRSLGMLGPARDETAKE